MKRKPSLAATPSPVETQLQDTGEQQLSAQRTALTGAQDTVGGAKSTLDATTPALSRFTTADATGVTPLRRALNTSLTSSTSTAYNNALVASRQRALQTGLQAQPLQAGNEAAIENERAKALGTIPSQVEEKAAPLEMSAIGLQNQQAGIRDALAGTETDIGKTFAPASYLGPAAGLESERQNALNQQYLDEQRRKSGLWAGLAKAGLSLAAPFTGGLSRALGGATERLGY